MQIERIAAENAPWELLLLADPAEALVREYLADGVVFAAKEEAAVLGVLVLVKTRPRTAEIMSVAVREERQNQGIGKRLIRQAIAYAREAGFLTLEIGTGNPGVVQMLLYQKCGFRIVGIDFDHFRKHNDERIFENGIECRDMIRMRMELDGEMEE